MTLISYSHFVRSLGGGGATAPLPPARYGPVDFNKAFNTVSRQGLWQVLKKYGCTEKFVSLIEALHTGMQANVAMSGSVSNDV